jgi:hypothetical protein
LCAAFIVRSIENDDPPPVSVASPTRRPRAASPMSKRPDPMKVFEVGQCTTEASASRKRSISRGSRWMAWP